MHANWPNFWNRDRMYPAMGYEPFFSIRDFDRTPVIGLGLSDARFVEQAAERLAALPEPFYAVLVTLSNHAPFVDPNLPRTLPLGALEGTAVGDYLNSVRFTDAALGVLVDRLRATGCSIGPCSSSTAITTASPGRAAAPRSSSSRAPGRRVAPARGAGPLLVRLPGGRARGSRAATRPGSGHRADHRGPARPRRPGGPSSTEEPRVRSAARPVVLPTARRSRRSS